jgi:uncharacterized protein YdhG (YjbR/CyaY superfamily)
MKKTKGLTSAERSAMKDRIKEMKGAGEGEAAVLAAIAKMSGQDKAMAKQIHTIVTTAAPELAPKTWYGMPAYAKDDKVVCFFKSGAKFKSRYATLGFSDKAALDEGDMWATDFALKTLTSAVEARISALVKKAVS